MRRLYRLNFFVSVLIATLCSVQAGAADGVCPVIAAPVKALVTQSKYDQSDRSRSTISENAYKQREDVLKPIRASIAQLAQLTANPHNEPQSAHTKGACITENLVRWAQAEALTQMETSDAYLVRDRFVSEILLTLLSSAETRPMTASERAAIAPWLITIADSTVLYYENRAGAKSRMNNHRYWAGLAVGTIGIFMEKPEYEDWGTRSYQLGVCQVDAEGYLPLELLRGARALEYHVYSLRPLQALAVLAAARGKDLESQCNGGLKRLRDQTLASIRNSDAISERAGFQQTGRFNETSFIRPLHVLRPGST
jgi:hypothetical protein